MPAVSAVGANSLLPLSGADESTGFIVEGRTPPDAGKNPHTHPRAVSPDYFRAIGILLSKGRVFTESDEAETRRAAVINETMARQFWPGEDPIGRRVSLDYEAWRFFPDRPPQFDLERGLREIVGVVGTSEATMIGFMKDLRSAARAPGVTAGCARGTSLG